MDSERAVRPPSVRPSCRAWASAVGGALVIVAGETTTRSLRADSAQSETDGLSTSGRGASPAAAAASTAPSFEIGAVGQYVSAPIRGGANPFGAGFGGRAGLVVSNVYVGLSVVDFIGDSDVDVSYRALLFGVDVGYAFEMARPGGTVLALRPIIGVGDAVVYYTDPSQKVDVVSSASGASSSSTISVHAVYVRPSLALVLASSGHFAAIAANALVLPSITYGGADPTSWMSLGLEAQLGLRF